MQRLLAIATLTWKSAFRFRLFWVLSVLLLVSVIALSFAVPLGVSAAIYVSEIAGPKERNFVKPYIEFISAIPSVVLGFFGIAVLGTALRWISQTPWLSWFPGFPMSERLNSTADGRTVRRSIDSRRSVSSLRRTRARSRRSSTKRNMCAVCRSITPAAL